MHEVSGEEEKEINDPVIPDHTQNTRVGQILRRWSLVKVTHIIATKDIPSNTKVIASQASICGMLQNPEM
jgi:hypothetical protein